MSEFDFRGTAVVTGAAGGIGRALARRLASRGSALVLVDRDAAGLDALAAELTTRHPGREITSYTVDLSESDSVHRLGRTLAEAHPGIRLLVNNAGVALSGSFEQCSKEDVDWLLAVNLLAPIDLVRELLPTLRRNSGSHIVNVSSVFGLVAPAGNVAYSASKFGIRGFTEALGAELAPAGIGVTSVHPGGIRTGIALSARLGTNMTDDERARAAEANVEFDKVLSIAPERAADIVMAGIARRRPRVLIGASATVPDIVARVFPTRYHRVVEWIETAARVLPARGTIDAATDAPRSAAVR
ncbi:SDR family NAD(P)-dependent oxidoreductase [Rhodococcoides corynebacterioides]|uniref:SDR family NAD(P)-dependent oxidoreductase n=1 Tax=Rhodococcoides corynebacterioides TaxID=53972 RepID=UPI00082BAFEB|nr:SDR family NAD(P)-dependent oxidoreductase [Rhodococcus corynebacterioides]